MTNLEVLDVKSEGSYMHMILNSKQNRAFVFYVRFDLPKSRLYLNPKSSRRQPLLMNVLTIQTNLPITKASFTRDLLDVSDECKLQGLADDTLGVLLQFTDKKMTRVLELPELSEMVQNGSLDLKIAPPQIDLELILKKV